MTVHESVANRLGATPAIALGATVAMWAASYPLLLPAFDLPDLVATPVFTACFLLAGWIAGRRAGMTFKGGAKVGLLITGVNLIVLGSLFGGDAPDEVVAKAIGPVIGFAVLAVGLGGIGAVIGSRRAGPPADWTSVLAFVVALATLMLMIAGGAVTSLEAGMAVPGWLTAFDYPLVLFPLERMRETAGIFAEHSHRLWGLLVGVSTIILVWQVFRSRQRGWVKCLALAVLGGVIIQGVAGGTRVIGDSIVLAIAHGFFAHAVLGAMMVLFVATWPSHQSTPATPDESGRIVAPRFVAALLLQLVFGAVYRHLNGRDDVPTGLIHASLGMHIIFALVVMALAIITGSRAMHCGRPCMKFVGLSLHVTVTLQVCFGIGAIALILSRTGDTPPALEVVVTSIHHAIAALLMALGATFAAWARR